MSDKQTADRINDSLEEPAPEMGDAPELTVELVHGTEIDGEWVTTATVREMTGEDEEALAPLGDDEDLLYTDYLTAILSRAVVSLGDHKVTEALLQDLVLGDRDTLFLNAIRASYGPVREAQAVCPHCQEMNDVVIELGDDFPLHPPSFDPQEGIIVEGKRGTYVLRMPTGRDMAAVQREDAPSVPQFNTQIMSLCVVHDKEPKDRVAWARRLNLADRRLLIDTLLMTKVGPELEGVDAQCAACQEDFRLSVDWASLLLG